MRIVTSCQRIINIVKVNGYRYIDTIFKSNGFLEISKNERTRNLRVSEISETTPSSVTT
jgi:hypothetical protein